MLAQLGHVHSVAVRKLGLLDNAAEGEVQALALVRRICVAVTRGRLHYTELQEQVQALRQVPLLVLDLAKCLQFEAHREAAQEVEEDQASLLLDDFDRGPVGPLHGILSALPLHAS